MKAADRQVLKAACMDNPKPGDYWYSRNRPIALVLAVEGDLIAWCHTIKELPDQRGFIFDLDRVVKTHKDMLKLRVNAHGDNECNVMPSQYQTIVDLWVGKGSKLYSPIPPANPSEKVHQLITEWAAKHKIYLMAPQWRDLETLIRALVGEAR